MKIQQVDVHHVVLQLLQPFETAFWRVTQRDILILKVYADTGVTFSEAPTLDEPTYTSETRHTVVHVIRDFLAPALIGRDINSLQDLHQAMAFVRGHHIAKSTFDTAFCHLTSAQNNQSLSQYLGGTRAYIDSGISIGIQPNLDALVERVQLALDEGFRRIKIKIKPGWDIEPVRAIRSAFGGIPLMVDANSAYTLDSVDVFKQLDAYELLMVEQPLAYDDIYEHSQLQRQIATPICLDESIDSIADARTAIALEACRIINIKLFRVGGFLPAVTIHNMCQENGIPVWCGGMVESAIGQSDGIALASLPNFTFPADIAPSERYFARDVISPFIELEAGHIKVPTASGLGFTVDDIFLNEATVEKIVLR